MTTLGNLGGTFTPDMASLTRLATSAPFGKYLSEQFYLKSRMFRSGVVSRNAELLTATIGTRVEAPFHKLIDPVEEKMESSSTWGTSGAGHFTVQKTGSGTQYATITHRGFAFGADKLAKLATNEDPLEVVGDQLVPALDKLMTRKLIAHAEGLLGTGGPLNATNSLNKSVTTGATEANYLTADNVVEARYLLGEQQESITTMFVNSPVAAYLERIGFLAYDGDRGGFGRRQQIGIFGNLQVIVDDQLPVIGTSGQRRQFVCYLAGEGAFLKGDQVPIEIEFGRNPLSKQDVLVVDYHDAQHVPGTSWSAAYDNPSNAQLLTGSNWSLKFSDPRMIPLVRLVVNSPYGGVI
jgi:hypothetical protein